jgi:pyrroloquinoline-quinone synthase
MLEERSLITWVAREAEKKPILSNRYFQKLALGGDPAWFIATQQQFFFAVRYFSRPMAALTARMPSSTLRQGLVHNLAEEQGASYDHAVESDPSLAHDMTFLQFLGTLGVGKDKVAALREGPSVRAFNTSLMGTCMMEPIPVAFGCMGVIEYAFAGISAKIGESVVRHGWIPHEDLVHYKLHAEIDERHAAEFFQVVEPDWAGDPARRAKIEDGVRLGLHVFGRFYEDLLSETEQTA